MTESPTTQRDIPQRLERAIRKISRVHLVEPSAVRQIVCRLASECELFAPRMLRVRTREIALPVRWKQCVGLVSAAFRYLGAQEGLAALAASGSELESRMAIVDYLTQIDSDDGIPLYSLNELAGRLQAFVQFLNANARSLLRYGLPKYFFVQSKWLYQALGRLYPTKRTDGRERNDHETNISAGAPLWYEWIYAETPEPGFGIRRVRCGYDEADLRAEISASEAARIESLRPKLFEAKLAIIDRLVGFLRANDGRDIWHQCSEILQQSLTATEVEFCLGVDRQYVHVPDEWKGLDPVFASLIGHDRPISPGGLSDLVQLIGHVDDELNNGSMRGIRVDLDPYIVETDWDNCLSVSDTAWPYFSLLRDSGEVLHRAIQRFQEREQQSAAFWREYHARVQNTFQADFVEEITVSVRVRRPHANAVRSRVTNVANFIANEANTSGSIPQIDLNSRTSAGKSGPRGERFPAAPGLGWNDVTMRFLSERSLKVCAGGMELIYNPEDIGFLDRRTTGRPDKQWLLLWLIARHGGTVKWPSDADRKTKDRVKAHFKRLRDKLMNLMRIDDDPFYDHRAHDAYVTKFTISAVQEKPASEEDEDDLLSLCQ